MFNRSLPRRTFLHQAALAPMFVPALLAGCTPKRGATSHSNDGHIPDVLRYCLSSEPTTLDPALVIDTETSSLLWHVYESLLRFGVSGKMEPLLAASLPEIDPTGRFYTFRLRPGVRFHNGREVTAEDVRYSYTRPLLPALASPWAMIVLDDIVGARDVADGKTDTLAGIEVLDSHTVRIQLIGPRAYAASKIGNVPIVARETVESGPKNERNVPVIELANTAGTGPFKLTSYLRQSRAVLDANKNYWGGAPPLARIERPVVLDTRTVRNLYEAGQLDLCSLTHGDYAEANRDPQLREQIRTYPTANVYFIEFSQRGFAPLRDRRVRRALAHAVDRDAVVSAVLFGTGSPAYSLLAPGMPGADRPFPGLRHDPGLSKRLLAEAGYGPANPLPTLTLRYAETQPDSARLAQVLREQWAAVGVPVNLQEMEWGMLLKAEAAGDFHANIMGWTPSFPDPNAVLSALLLSHSPQNVLGYDSPAFDHLCRAADADRLPERRAALYFQAMQVAIEDAPLIPLYFQSRVELVKEYVSNLEDTLLERLPHARTQVS